MLVKEKEAKYYITRLTSGRCICSSRDLVDLIDCFNKPAFPAAIQPCYDEKVFLPAIERLKEIGILVPGNTTEETEVLAEWQNRIQDLVQLTPADNTSPFIIYGGNDDQEHADCFIKATAPLIKELACRLFPFKRKIYTVLLSGNNYEKTADEYHIPRRTTAFVDSKSVLVLNTHQLTERINKTEPYARSIKHELIHVLLGQRHYYIPAWIEEGICELYSGQKYFPMAEELIKKRKKTYRFTEAEPLITNSIMDIDDSPVTRNTVYVQAYSFVKYLVETVGEKTFWTVIENTGICLNFREVFLKITKQDISDLENAWAASLDEAGTQ